MTKINVVVNKPATRITITNGMLHITCGDDDHKLPLNKINNLQIAKSCSLTTDVLEKAVEHGIDVLLITRKGDTLARLWSNRFGSISTIRKNQLAFAESKDAVQWMKQLLTTKLQHQQALLITLYRIDKTTDTLIEETISYLDKYEQKINELNAESIAQIADTWRGWEGSCSRKYFACLNAHLPDMYRFEKRSQHPAADMFNAMLNYCYGMLYAKVEGELIKAGIDPFIGILHRNDYNKPVLSYDVIEVFRYWADYAVTNLCMQQVIFPEMFEVEDGAWWLAGEAKRIVIQSMTDYMEEVIEWRQQERTRNTHIALYCEQLAGMLKNWQGAAVNQTLNT